MPDDGVELVSREDAGEAAGHDDLRGRAGSGTGHDGVDRQHDERRFGQSAVLAHPLVDPGGALQAARTPMNDPCDREQRHAHSGARPPGDRSARQDGSQQMVALVGNVLDPCNTRQHAERWMDLPDIARRERHRWRRVAQSAPRSVARAQRDWVAHGQPAVEQLDRRITRAEHRVAELETHARVRQRWLAEHSSL